MSCSILAIALRAHDNRQSLFRQVAQLSDRQK